MRINLTLIVAIGLIPIFFSCYGHSDESPQSKPNVILIYADDMGYGEIQALDPKQSKIPTPNLNTLVQQGMVFTDAHTTSSVCTPSRYSLLTGRYNWRMRLQRGVVQGGEEPLIAANRLTLPGLLKQQGYDTAIVGKWHLEYQYEFLSTFENSVLANGRLYSQVNGAPLGTKIIEGPTTRGFNSFYGFHHSRIMNSFVRNDEVTEQLELIDVLPALTDEVTDLIDQKAEQAKNGKPFFIYFAQSSPHTPIVPSKEWQGKTELGDYGDFVAQTDGTVGAVMDALEKNGLADNTIVIFSADNGTSKEADIEFLQSNGHYPSAGLRGAKSDLWEGGHRVPFIVRWPGAIPAGTVSDQLISLVDLLATFADYFSVDLPDNAAEDSISFLPALFEQSLDNPRNSIVHHSLLGRFSIRKGDWKLLLSPGSGGWSAPTDIRASAAGEPALQLYNLATDIGEKNNLQAEYPEKVEELTKLLEALVAEGRSTPGTKQENDVPVDIWKDFLNKADR